MSDNQKIFPRDASSSSHVAENRENEEYPTDSQIELIQGDEKEVLKVCLTVGKYESNQKKESEEIENEDQDKDAESDTGSNVIGDICRICHMGSFPPLNANRPMWEWRTQPRSVENRESNLSNFAYLGPLISACKCRGTVGLVHVECLERWLTESRHTSCELCGHKFATKRVPRHGVYRSIIIWFSTVFATRQMVMDILYLAATTPLALFSIYICGVSLKVLLQSGVYEIPWITVAMLPTCSLILLAYWGWLLTLGRYIGRFHSRRWHRFWRDNFVVRLALENINERNIIRDPVPEREEENELDQWQDENFDSFFNINSL